MATGRLKGWRLRLLGLWIGLALVGVARGSEKLTAPVVSPLQVTRTVLLAEEKVPYPGASAWLISYGRVREAGALKRHVEPGLYALILERAKLLEKVQAAWEKLGENRRMELAGLEADNVFLWNPFIGKRAAFTERVSGAHAEVHVRDAFMMDGGVNAKSRTEFVFEKRKGEWVLVRSQRWLSVDGSTEKEGLELARGLRLDIEGFRRMLAEAKKR